MRNPQIARILWISLAVEVGLGLLCLVASRAISSLIVIALILGLMGGVGFFLRYLAAGWAGQMFGQTRLHSSQWPGNSTPANSENRSTGSWNIGNVNINLGNYPERSEVLNELIPLEEGQTGLMVNVSSGAIKITGQEGLSEIRIVATKRVWARDEGAARFELDRLQLRHWREGNLLRIEAGDPNQGFVIGRGARVDLDIQVPPTILLNLTTSAGEISCQQFHGDLLAKTTFGSLSIEGYNSGRNITLTTTSGRVNLRQVAAGTIRIRAGAGTLDLVGVGAELIELESTAGSVRGRGINCGRYLAHATTGSVELYQAQVEFGLELRTGAGRILAEDIKTASLRLEATSGTIFYRGGVPGSASEVVSGVGSVQLLFSPGAAFNLSAHSNVGSVETFLPVSRLGTQSRNAFEGQIGGGGTPVRVSSQVGSIRVGIS